MYTEETLHRDGLRGVGLNPHKGAAINIYNASITTPNITLSNPFPTELLSGAVPDIWGIETPSPIAVSHSWGLSIQHALTPNLLLEVAYQGQHDTHQVDWTSFNDATPNASANRQLFRPYPQWQFVQMIMNDGDAHYEGLELKVETSGTPWKSSNSRNPLYDAFLRLTTSGLEGR
jgi:hypothetical protein